MGVDGAHFPYVSIHFYSFSYFDIVHPFPTFFKQLGAGRRLVSWTTNTIHSLIPSRTINHVDSTRCQQRIFQVPGLNPSDGYIYTHIRQETYEAYLSYLATHHEGFVGIGRLSTGVRCFRDAGSLHRHRRFP